MTLRAQGEPGFFSTPIGHLIDRLLTSLMRRAAGSARLVVAGAVLLAFAAAAFTSGHLGMETDSNALLSPDLPHRKTQASFDKAFPQLGDNIVIVIDAKTTERADAAGAALAERLRARGDLYKHVFHPEGDPFFRKNGLLFQSVDELQTIADRLADAQPLLAVLAKDTSLRGLFDLLSQASRSVVDGDADPAPLVDAFGRIGDAIEAFVGGRDTALDWSEMMRAKPSTPSDRRRFILTQPFPDYSSMTLADSAIGTIRAAVGQLGLTEANGVRVRLTGGIPIREDELRSIGEGAGWASLISFVIVSILVYVGLRSLRLMLAILISLVIGLTWTAAFAALTIGHLNLLSVAFAVMFIGIAVDFGIQVGLRYQENAANGLDQLGALDHSAKTAAAVCLAALCATIGFVAFVPTSYVGLAELGIISGGGMTIGAICALTVLPALLALMPPRTAATRPEPARAMAARAVFVTRHYRAICLGALALGLASLAAIPFIRFDFDPIALDDPKAESVQTYVDLAGNGSTSPYAINVVLPNLDAASALGRRLEALPVVDSTITLRSFIPENQDEKLRILADMALFMAPVLNPGERIPPPSLEDDRHAAARLLDDVRAMIASPGVAGLAEPARRLSALVEQVLRDVKSPESLSKLEHAMTSGLPYQLDALRLALSADPVGLESLPADLRRRYVDDNGQARVEVFPKETLTDRDALRRFVIAVQRVAPDATDTPVLLLQGGDAIVSAFVHAGAIALICIAILLVLVLRSIVAAIQVLLPLLLALTLTLAIMAVTGMAFNFANIIALPLLLTLGVAFGIYLVLRYREIGDVARLMATSTPRAVLFSALTTMVSFGSLMVSSHRGTASMGMLLTICLTLAVACTLVVLPALLAWEQKRRSARAGLDAAGEMTIRSGASHPEAVGR